MKKFDFEDVGKRMPYSVPEGFFERSKRQTLCATTEYRRPVNKSLRWAVAVAVVAMVCCAAWWSMEYNSPEKRYERMLAESSSDILWKFAGEYDSDIEREEFLLTDKLL